MIELVLIYSDLELDINIEILNLINESGSESNRKEETVWTTTLGERIETVQNGWWETED